MAQYGAKDVRVLEEVEHIRLNSGMYIGETSTPVHLVEELLDNALDEALAGYAKIIAVLIDTKNNIYSVLDNGRGVPIEDDTPLTISYKLFSGAKFQDKKSAYQISSGLHGVGLVAVNALSDKYKIEIYRNKQYAVYQFEKTKLKFQKIDEYTGEYPFSTKIEFQPSKKYFTSVIPDIERIRMRLTTASAEMANDITFVLSVDGKQEVIKRDMTTHFAKECLSSKEKINVTLLNSDHTPEKFHVLFAYEVDGPVTPKIISSVNLLPVKLGGSHINAFYDILKDFFQKQGKKYGYSFQPTDCLYKLRAYFMLSLIEPKFSGQTKDSLINVKTEFDKFMKDFRNNLDVFAKQKEDLLKDYMQRFQDYRVKLDSKKLVKLGTNGRRASTQFTKLRDCTRRDGELYIVEGDSAAGCCLGSTKIKLTDGRDISIIDLVKEDFEGKENFIYAYDHNSQSIKIQKILHPRKTKINANLVKINLDNGKHIICTPDHKFMLRDGTYIRAFALQKNDSLMPLYTKILSCKRRLKCGLSRPPLCYEKIFQPYSGKFKLTHWIADEWNLQNGIYSGSLKHFHRHHIDKNSLNNNPSNIIRLSLKNHIKIHIEDSNEIQKTDEYRKYLSSKMKEQSESISKRSKKLWENEEYKEYMKMKWKEFYNSNKKYREQNSKHLDKIQKDFWAKEENRKKQSKTTKEYYQTHPEEIEKRRVKANEQWKSEDLRRWRSKKTKEQMSSPEMIQTKIKSEEKSRLHKCLLKIKELGIDKYIIFRKNQPRKYMKIDTIIKKFFNGNEENFKNTIQNYNHKVLSVEFLNYRDDVYDLEVPIYHNFATSAGVFIHNSIIQSRDTSIHAILPLKGKSIPNITTKKNILQNKEVGELVKAIGAGVDTHFEIDKMRYKSIICATDADYDGNHIACLVTMVISILMPEIVQTGRYFIAQTPLFAINEGKVFIPLWTEEALEEARVKKRVISRFKGLGELNPNQLKICLLDEKTRNHIPIKYTKDLGKLVKLFSSAEEKRKLVVEE